MSHKHDAMIDKIFAHPIAANLDWKKLSAALTSLGAQIEESHHHRAKITLNGAVLSIRLPHHGADIESKDDIMALRHFLQEQGIGSSKG